jgi:hypothetical protein
LSSQSFETDLAATLPDFRRRGIAVHDITEISKRRLSGASIDRSAGFGRFEGRETFGAPFI